MIPSVIKFNTCDNKSIYSLLYSESNQEQIVVLIHGACMNYMTGICLFVPQMTKSFNKYDFLSVNMRAHDIGYIENNYVEKEGWAWQTIAGNQYDLDAVVTHLRSNGYKKIILCAHSWGGLICLDYVQTHDNIDGLILFSPTISYKLLIEVNYRKEAVSVVENAQKMISQGLPNEIISTAPKSPLPFMSAKTICDFYSSSFDAVKVLKKIKHKTNIIVGGLEHQKLIACAEDLTDYNCNIQMHKITGANHFYWGYELEAVKIVDSILGGKNE